MVASLSWILFSSLPPSAILTFIVQKNFDKKHLFNKISFWIIFNENLLIFSEKYSNMIPLAIMNDEDGRTNILVVSEKKKNYF